MADERVDGQPNTWDAAARTGGQPRRERERVPMGCYEQHITRSRGVQGGEPVVRGTRTPVRTIAILYHETYPDDLERVRASLPHLTREQIEAALEYYRAHQTEIDAAIEWHRKALSEFSSPS